MRPSVTEQLDGLRRILQEVVAPELSDPYPADILAGVCASLETLAIAWAEVPAFLRWDATTSASLLSELLALAGPRLGEELAAEVRAAVEAPIPYLDDVSAVEAHHRQVRSALEHAIPVIAGREELSETRRRLVVLLRERSDRYPLKAVWRPAIATAKR
jgi:hypothetical protein